MKQNRERDDERFCECNCFGIIVIREKKTQDSQVKKRLNNGREHFKKLNENLKRNDTRMSHFVLYCLLTDFHAKENNRISQLSLWFLTIYLHLHLHFFDWKM
jgi:hypothetical protein